MFLRTVPLYLLPNTVYPSLPSQSTGLALVRNWSLPPIPRKTNFSQKVSPKISPFGPSTCHQCVGHSISQPMSRPPGEKSWWMTSLRRLLPRITAVVGGVPSALLLRFIHLKGKLERQTSHSLAQSPNRCKDQAKARLKPRASCSSPVRVQGPITQAVLCYFPKCISRELIQKWSSCEQLGLPPVGH